MKQNQNFDHNHSQKVLSCRYNMDTNRVGTGIVHNTTPLNRLTALNTGKQFKFFNNVVRMIKIIRTNLLKLKSNNCKLKLHKC